MFTQIRAPGQHFNAFYEDNSLLIQFIVEEFLHSYQLTLKIKGLIQKCLDSNHTLNSLPASLLQNLGQLVGYYPHYHQTSFSRWNKGPLTKFKEYCEQFSRNSSYQNKQHIDLYMAAHQTWLMAIHNLALLNSLRINPYTPNTETILFLLPLKPAFDALEMCFNQMSRYIPQIVKAYWNNENVILCLLRKKALLTEIYGNNFLHKQFKCPMKIAELIPLLIQRYQARGFETLLPTIQHLHQVEEAL